MSQAPHTDMPSGGWFERIFVPWQRPYARLARFDRPIGSWLLLLPCWWGVALATIEQHGIGGFLDAAPLPGIFALSLLFIGAIVMRGAGCVINDIVDRDIDRKVERTRGRPLAAGDVALSQAVVFLAILLLIGLCVLVALPWNAIILGLAIMPVVVIYPFMKRVTWWPQVFLGIAFNWGALVGYATMAESLQAQTLLIYAAGFFWTLGYDTVYAHQDKEDDALVGVRSTARLFGRRSLSWISGFYATMVALLAAAGFAAGLGPLFWVGLAFTALHLFLQLRRVDFDDPASCLAVFRSNQWTGLIVFAALIAGSWKGGV